jgi:acetyl esterase/lipase
MRLVLISFLTLFTTAELVAQSRIESNVVYGMFSGLALLGDIHHPARPNGYGVVVVPGSAFSAPLSFDANALKNNPTGIDLANALNRGGYLAFVVNHRAAPRFQYPAAVEDVQRAVRFLRANATTYGIDPNRIGSVGSSSGGHLASMAGTLDGTGDPKATDVVLRQSAKVQAVVAFYAPFDLRIQFKESSANGVPEALFVGAGLREGLANSDSELKLHLAASPITHVSADDPPFLLLHGDEDTTVPMSQSTAMRAALEKASVPVTQITVKNRRHGRNFGLPPDDQRLQNYRDQMTRWLDKQLRNK